MLSYLCFMELFPVSVIGQGYQSEILSEHVMLSNDAIFKCAIPSFVSDFVNVESWLDNDAKTFYQNSNYGNFNWLSLIRNLVINFSDKKLKCLLVGDGHIYLQAKV